MTAVTINGNAYSDDGSQSRDMRFGGHQTWLLPLLQDAMTEVDAAVDSAVSADSSADAAAASAASAANYAAALIGTSTSANDIGTGGKTWTTQTAKQFTVGGYVQIIRQTDTSMWMIGQVTAYNSGTGSLTVTIEDSNGSGNYSGWDITVSGKRGEQGIQGINGAGVPTTTGSSGKILQVDSGATGTEWVTKPFQNIQIFTSSGTFTPPSGVTKFFVILIGGGGSGRRSSSGLYGGQSGACIYGQLEITAAQTVTIGAGGTGQSTNDTDGNAGSASSIGSIATANGGKGGTVTHYQRDAAGGSCSQSTALVLYGQQSATNEGAPSFLSGGGALTQPLGSWSSQAGQYGSGGSIGINGQVDSGAGGDGVAVFMW